MTLLRVPGMNGLHVISISHIFRVKLKFVLLSFCFLLFLYSRWSGGAMALGKLPVPGRPTIWMIVGQGPIALAVGAGGALFGHFYSPLSFLSSFSLSGRWPDIDWNTVTKGR